MTEQAWTDYLQAVRRLDEVRRTLATAAAEQATAAQDARAELVRLRDRLALQRSRLSEAAHPAGPAGPELDPTPAEVDAATRTISGDPAAALDALRRTWSTVQEADAAVLAARSPGGGPADWPPPMRNLLVYGPLALIVLITQLVLYAVTSQRELPLYASLCGLVMPAAAFGLAYGTVGLLFPAPPGGRVDRTPLLGAAVCLISIVVMCAGLGVLIALR